MLQLPEKPHLLLAGRMPVQLQRRAEPPQLRELLQQSLSESPELTSPLWAALHLMILVLSHAQRLLAQIPLLAN